MDRLVEKRTASGEAGVQPEQRGSELQKPSLAGGTTRSRSAAEPELFAALVFLVPLVIRVRPDGRVKRTRFWLQKTAVSSASMAASHILIDRREYSCG